MRGCCRYDMIVTREFYVGAIAMDNDSLVCGFAPLGEFGYGARGDRRWEVFRVERGEEEKWSGKD